MRLEGATHVEWLSEDPWYVIGALGLVALGFLVALKITQQGKYLIRTGIALLLALAVFGIEQFWVTDAERIEAVVKDVGHAVGNADADAVLSYMTSDMELTQGPVSISGPVVRGTIHSMLDQTRFDFLTVSRIEAEAGELSGRGTATFRVHTSGSTEFGGVTYNFSTDPSGTDWSFGLEKTGDGQWKVNRITYIRGPRWLRLPIGRGGL